MPKAPLLRMEPEGPPYDVLRSTHPHPRACSTSQTSELGFGHYTRAARGGSSHDPVTHWKVPEILTWSNLHSNGLTRYMNLLNCFRCSDHQFLDGERNGNQLSGTFRGGYTVLQLKLSASGI